MYGGGYGGGDFFTQSVPAHFPAPDQTRHLNPPWVMRREFGLHPLQPTVDKEQLGLIVKAYQVLWRYQGHGGRYAGTFSFIPPHIISELQQAYGAMMAGGPGGAGKEQVDRLQKALDATSKSANERAHFVTNQKKQVQDLIDQYDKMARAGGSAGGGFPGTEGLSGGGGYGAGGRGGNALPGIGAGGGGMNPAQFDPAQYSPA